MDFPATDTSPDGITGKDTNGLAHTGTGNNAAITTHTQCRMYVFWQVNEPPEYTLLLKSEHNLERRYGAALAAVPV